MWGLFREIHKGSPADVIEHLGSFNVTASPVPGVPQKTPEAQDMTGTKQCNLILAYVASDIGAHCNVS